MAVATNQEIRAVIAHLEAAAMRCGMTLDTLLATFQDMGSACRANEGDDALESDESVTSEFFDLVAQECREVGITDDAAIRTAMTEFCVGYLNR